MHDQKFVATWIEDKRFADGVCLVVVKRSNHHRTRYSYEVLFQNLDRVGRFTYLRSEGEGTGKITCTRNSDSIGRAVTQAEDYISDMYQAQEDEAIERNAEKERAALNRDKPVVKPGLKTLSKMDRASKGVES
jgi:hypothetical protein